MILELETAVENYIRCFAQRAIMSPFASAATPAFAPCLQNITFTTTPIAWL